MKKLISILLTLTMILSCTLAFAEEASETTKIRYEGDGFDTPEDAVICYMNGLKNLDFEQMLSAFAWETLASHYSAEELAKRMKAYNPVTPARMPGFNEFMVTANLHSLRANESRMIYSALEAYIMGEEFPNGMAIALKEDADVDAFLKKFDNGKLEELSGMGEILFLTPDMVTKSKFSMEQNQNTLLKQTAQFGADELVNVVATAAVGKGVIVCMPTVARYGDRWYMVSVGSLLQNILGIDVNHQAFFYTEDALEMLFGR